MVRGMFEGRVLVDRLLTGHLNAPGKSIANGSQYINGSIKDLGERGSRYIL